MVASVKRGRQGIYWGIAIALMLVMAAISAGQMLPGVVAHGHPADVFAVQYCGDSESGHGGSKDNPPAITMACIMAHPDKAMDAGVSLSMAVDYDGRSVSEASSNMSISATATSSNETTSQIGAGEWILLGEQVKVECAKAVAEASLMAKAISQVTQPNERVLDQGETQKDIAAESEGCVKVETRVSARGSVLVE